MEKSADSLLVSLETVHQVLLEAGHAVGQDAHTVEQVADDGRLEDVELELTVHATNGSCNVVTHHLGADHGEGLALGRVDLARHDRRTRLVLGEDQLVQTAAGTGSEVTDVLSDLEQRGCQSVQGTGGLDDGVVGSQNLELVGSSLELGAGHLGHLRSDGLVEALEGVQASSDSSTTLGKVTEVRDACLDTLNVTVELGDVAGKLLTKSQGSGVLQVRTTDLDDLFEGIHLDLQGVAQALQGGEQSVLEFDDGSNVHSSGERVVGRGRHVDVVVGVDGLLGAHGATQDLNSTVGDHFVRVHVGLSTGTGLPDNEREMVEQLALRDLSSSLLDGLTDLGIFAHTNNSVNTILQKSAILFVENLPRP